MLNMNELTSKEVPQVLSEWLLSMGCHPEVIPSADKLELMCRGQYYMVWRSLMKKVESKEVIEKKRPQVFYDDIRKCQKKNVFSMRDVNSVVPEELLLWQRHTQLKEKVADAEARVKKEKEENLQQLIEKANSKLRQRYLLQKRLQDSQRRVLLLQRLADQLKHEQANLLETKTIAESLCGLNEDTDVESMLDRCMASLTREAANLSKLGASLASAANPAASSTIASTSGNNNDEEAMSSLSRCRGDLLYKQLYERRAGLCVAIPANHPDTTTDTKRVRSVVCHTASLLCSLALEATKNRIHAERIRNKLGETFLQLGNYLSSDACELIVTRCEVARSEARIASLRSACEQVSDRSGAFAAEQTHNEPASYGAIHAVDKAIESKRDELKRLMTSVAALERKTQNVRERLLSHFNGFHDDGARDRFGGPSSFPQESIATLRQFYEEKREKSKNKLSVSMNLDISDDCSFNLPDNGSPTFIDELKFYMNKFSLEKNRKLVLESGEKVWIFESTSALLQDIHRQWQSDNITSSLLYPSVAFEQNLLRPAGDRERKEELETLLRTLEGAKRNALEIDISPSKEEEQKILDCIKKRLNENSLSLQKTSKILEMGLDDLHFWANNNIRKYISAERKVEGRSYMQFEKAYLAN